MSEHDAFEDAMDKELDIFLTALKAAVPERPDPRIEGPLVVRLAATARASQQAAALEKTAEQPRAAGRKAVRRVALPARIAFAAALLVASMAGLAVAGVKLPDTVESGFNRVGVSLPNQTDTSSQPAPATPAEPTGSSPPAPAQQPSQSHGTDARGSNARHGTHPGHAGSSSAGNNGQSGGSHGKGKALGRNGVPPGQAAQSATPHSPSKGSKSQGKSNPEVPTPPPTRANGKNK